MKGIDYWAFKANPFWQDESYDHLVRSGEFERIRIYIEENPVKAGLVRTLLSFDGRVHGVELAKGRWRHQHKRRLESAA